MLTHTSTEWAPWHVIPADHKWFMRTGAAAVLVNTLVEIDPRYPTVNKKRREELLEIKQGPRGGGAEGRGARSLRGMNRSISCNQGVTTRSCRWRIVAHGSSS